MKPRNPLAMLFAAFMSCLVIASAMAGETTLEVTNRIRDDGAHAFMPAWNGEGSRAEPFTITARSSRLQDPQPEPQLWSAAYVFRLCGDKDDRASAGALRHITDLTRGGKLRVNVDAYAGASLRKAVPVAAVLLGMQWQAFDQAWLTVHGGWTVTGGQPSGVCVGVSANVRLGGAPATSTERQVLSQLEPSMRF